LQLISTQGGVKQRKIT